MILREQARPRKGPRQALPYQREDFTGIFEGMDKLPVTVRLLDPPLHEFLPHDAASQKELAESLGVKASKIKNRVSQLHEQNPMLGHFAAAGSRSPIPEILQMQVRAIVEATIDCREKGLAPKPEIMIPLVGTKKELARLRELTLDHRSSMVYTKPAGLYRESRHPYRVGTMMEITRATLGAGRLRSPKKWSS